jgi:hypothetical protein
VPFLGPHAPHEIHEVTELRTSVPQTGGRLLPLPVAAWHAPIGRATLDPIVKGDASEHVGLFVILLPTATSVALPADLIRPDLAHMHLATDL